MSDWHFLKGAWRRLPVELAIVAAATVAAVCGVHELGEAWVPRVLLAALWATPVAFALHGLADGRAGRPRAAAALGGALAFAGALALLGVALPGTGSAARTSFLWPYGLCLGAALLAPFVVAGRRFSSFVRHFFEQLTVWGLVWLGALAAIVTIAGALQGLFELEPQRLAADVALVMTAGFLLVFLDRLLPGGAPGSGRVPELWRRLATTVGAPFVAAMLVILVAYEGYVLVTGALPRNLLSPLILGAGLGGFLCTLVIHAVTVEPVGSSPLVPPAPLVLTRRWTVRLAQAFPAILLALLPMAGWALWQRIDQYGLTPFRVVRAGGLICLAVLCAASVPRWLRGRPPLSWQVPAVIALFALGLAIGPLGAVGLSVGSQARRLARLLDESGVTERTIPAGAGAPARTVNLAPERQAEIAWAAREMEGLGGAAALRRVLAGDLAGCLAEPDGVDACLGRLGIAGEHSSVWVTAELVPGAAVPLGDGRWVRLVHLAAGLPDPTGLALEGDAVVLRRGPGGPELARASLLQVMERAAGKERALEPMPVVLHGADDAGGRLVVQRVELSGAADGSFALVALDAVWVAPLPPGS
jgi:hypothetical protein